MHWSVPNALHSAAPKAFVLGAIEKVPMDKLILRHSPGGAGSSGEGLSEGVSEEDSLSSNRITLLLSEISTLFDIPPPSSLAAEPKKLKHRNRAINTRASALIRPHLTEKVYLAISKNKIKIKNKSTREIYKSIYFASK